MSRLTEKYNDAQVVVKLDPIYVGEITRKLAYYEDLEEQGRLIEQKHGRWITETVDVQGRVEIMGHYCSNCEHYEEAPEDTVNVEDFYTNYCPNCGAKMDEVKNE